MARFLMATMPMVGHVNPGLPIARRLMARGHEVYWYTGQRFQKRIEATGARFAPMREAHDYDDRDLNAAFPARTKLSGLNGLRYDLKHVFIDPIPGQMADLRTILRTFPADVIVSDTGFVGASMLHLRGEAPPVAVFSSTIPALKSRDTAPFGLALPPNSSPLGRLRNRALDWALNRLIFRDVNAYANAMRRRIGVPTTRQGIYETSLSAYLYLLPVVPEFDYPRTDLPPQVHFIGPFLPDPTENFVPPSWWDELQAGKPVVHVTQGTIAIDPAELIVPTIQGLAGEDVLVVATTGGQPVEAVRCDPRPANLRLERFVPHDRLLPHVDVMVTNGGYNGVQVALANGVPLVAGGSTEDKPEVCNRIAWTGLGVNLKTATPTPEQVRAAVRTILDDKAYRERARHMATEIARYDAASSAATLLEQLAATGKPVLAEQRPAGMVAGGRMARA
jgi:MGT family glycosyltransferase